VSRSFRGQHSRSLIHGHFNHLGETAAAEPHYRCDHCFPAGTIVYVGTLDFQVCLTMPTLPRNGVMGNVATA